MSELDLALYFDRIRWTGDARPTLDTLARLLMSHTAAFPFENVDVLLGRGVRLDLEGLQEKMIQRKRGGYCFEHATLFAAVLEALGYSPTRHSGRVVLVSPPSEAPRTHMFLTVRLAEGTFVVDPGFGGHAPRVPIPLVDGKETSFGDQTHAMARRAGTWTLRVKIDGAMRDAWITSLERDNLIDFEVANHYTATHPKSAFRNMLMLRAITPEGRVTAMNRDVTFTRNGQAEKSQLSDRKALRALLAQHFGFDLPEVETMRVPAIEGWS